MSTVRETLLDLFIRHGASLYRDTDYGPEPVPHYLTSAERDEQATHVEIPLTGWGDYSGDSLTRSNQRAMLADLPDLVVEVTSGYGWHVNVIALDADVEDVEDQFAHLLDYPVWDENDHSDLTMELEREDWDSWGRSDFYRDVEEQARKTYGYDDLVDPVLSYIDDLSHEERDNLASDVAYGDLGEHPYYYPECAVSGGWDRPMWQAWVDAVLARIVVEVNRADLPTHLLPVPVCQGQASLEVSV